MSAILAQDTILVGGHSIKDVLAGRFPEVFIIFLPEGIEKLPTFNGIDQSNLEAALQHPLMAGLFAQQKTMNRHLNDKGNQRSDLERAKIAANHAHKLLQPTAACGGLPNSGVVNYGQPVIAITQEANGDLLLHGRDDLKSGVRKIIVAAEGWDGLRYAAAFQRAKEKAEVAARRLCNKTSGCVLDFNHNGPCSVPFPEEDMELEAKLVAHFKQMAGSVRAKLQELGLPDDASTNSMYGRWQKGVARDGERRRCFREMREKCPAV